MLSKEEIDRRRQEWFDTVARRKVLIEKVCTAYNSGKKELARKLSNEMRALDPRECEHGRSWSSTCIACDEIHKECFPENYIPCPRFSSPPQHRRPWRPLPCVICKELFDPDDLYEENKCDQCLYDERKDK